MTQGVAKSLTHSGAALENGQVACSPTSGFHHAGYDSGYGFCTFNGLMVAALTLRAEGVVRRVGILDCDQHFGDGTTDILAKLGIDWVQHLSREYWSPENAAPFLVELPGLVRSFSDCDLLIYQAGADQHIKDPLGGFLTSTQLIERDHSVFSMAKSIGIPVVWNLAGGYQEPLSCVLEIHRNTLLACIDVYT